MADANLELRIVSVPGDGNCLFYSVLKLKENITSDPTQLVPHSNNCRNYLI